MNPTVIIDASDDAAFLQQLAKNPALQTVSAIKHHRLYAINSADLSSVSQYAVNGVRDLEAVLYPKHK
jgi:iron complex transport system substrate-binding protein